MENKRITEKLGVGFYVAEHAHNTDEITYKLGKLEDLEEELVCPLEVVFKALQNGIYTNVYSGLCYVGLYENYFQVSDDYVVYLKDYKHTWWLKEDKSE